MDRLYAESFSWLKPELIDTLRKSRRGCRAAVAGALPAQLDINEVDEFVLGPPRQA